MSWSLSASGHISSEENTLESETKVAKVIQAAIMEINPQDISTAHFGGNYVQGDLRTLVLE